MCGSMVDIQSPTAEIRRGKKKRRSQGKNIMVCPIPSPCTNVHVLTQELPILNCHMDIVIQIDIYKEINLLTPITCNSIE